MTASIQETLDAIKKAQSSAMSDPSISLGKSATFEQSGSATSGLTYYDLELGAKLLYPVLTPLRNEIPRVSGKGGIQAAWRAVTAINPTGMRAGVSQGNRGGVMSVQTADYTAAYKGLGLEDSVTFEGQYAGMGFDDIRAVAAQTLLQATMIQEEYTILGGNGSTGVALGTTPTPALADVTSGGTLLANTQYSVICVALSFDATVNGSVTGGIQGQITRTNADGSTDTFGGGAARKSSAATVTTANDAQNDHSITAALAAAVLGATGYAWFWGASGSEVLGAITANPSYTITADATGTQTAASLGSGDNSQNSLVFDGLLYQALKTGSGAYVKNVAGTLTGDSAAGIAQIDVALKSMWDNYRLSPDTMWVNSQQAQDISAKILANGSNGAQRFVFATAQDATVGGVMATTYLNKFSMQGASTIAIRIHPNMPAGTILMTSKTIPYPLSEVGNVMQIRTRQDYYQIQWPLVTRKYELGVYMDEVLQHYFPPSMAVLYNITAG